MAAAQSSRTVEEIWAHSKMAEEDRSMLKEQSWRQRSLASAPSSVSSINAPAVLPLPIEQLTTSVFPACAIPGDSWTCPQTSKRGR